MRRTPLEGLWLRPLAPDDRPDLEVLSHEAFSDWAQQPARSVVAMAAAAEYTVVAVLDGTMAGFALGRRVEGPRRFGPWEHPHVQHIDAIAVTPRLRRRGVGSALLMHVIKLAKSDGARGLFAMTAANNRAARALFEGAEFDYLAGIRSAYREGEPAVLLTKYLRQHSKRT